MCSPMTCQESLPSANSWLSTMKSSAVLSNLRTTLFGSSSKNLKRNMTVTRTNSTRRPDMKWRSGQNSLTSTVKNSRSLTRFVHFAGNICQTKAWTPTALRTTHCSMLTPTLLRRSPTKSSFTRAVTGSVDHPSVKTQSIFRTPLTETHQIYDVNRWL